MHRKALQHDEMSLTMIGAVGTRSAPWEIRPELLIRLVEIQGITTEGKDASDGAYSAAAGADAGIADLLETIESDMTKARAALTARGDFDTDYERMSVGNEVKSQQRCRV